jgi:hypothetical protein
LGDTQSETFAAATRQAEACEGPDLKAAEARVPRLKLLELLKLLKKWGFALVPFAGLLELTAHLVQTTEGVVPAAEWKAARDVVAKKVRPTDLVVFAPAWTDPLGREYFGKDLATLEREARPDETRFPRAIEVSIRGKHRAELAGWRLIERERVGAFTIGTYDNPAPAKLFDDLLAHASPQAMSVTRVDGGHETACPWQHGVTQSGGLGFGPPVPGDKFACPGGGFIGVSVLHALDHSPRRCFFAPPSGGGSSLRVRFLGVTFGGVIHGHHGLQAEAERMKNGPPVTLTFSVGGRPIGTVVHNDGMGWAGFELPTPELSGQNGDLVAEIASTGGNRRHYCFEADTR